MSVPRIILFDIKYLYISTIFGRKILVVIRFHYGHQFTSLDSLRASYQFDLYTTAIS